MCDPYSEDILSFYSLRLRNGRSSMLTSVKMVASWVSTRAFLLSCIAKIVFSIGPTLKLKRKNLLSSMKKVLEETFYVMKKYEETIEALYTPVPTQQ